MKLNGHKIRKFLFGSHTSNQVGESNKIKFLGFLGATIALVIIFFPWNPIRALILQVRAGQLIESYLETYAGDYQDYFTCQIPALIELPEDEKLNQAVKLLETAQRIHPHYSHTNLQLGRAYCLKQDFFSATYNAFNRFSQARPGNQLGALEAGFAHFNITLQPNVPLPERNAHKNSAVNIFVGQGYSVMDFLKEAESAYQQQSFRAAWYWYRLANTFEPMPDEAVFRTAVLDLAFKQDPASDKVDFENLVISPEVIVNSQFADLLNQQRINSADLITAADAAFRQKAYRTAWYWYQVAKTLEPLPDEATLKTAMLDLALEKNPSNNADVFESLTLTSEEIMDIIPLEFYNHHNVTPANLNEIADAAFQNQSFRTAWYWYQIANSLEPLMDDIAFRFAFLDLAFAQNASINTSIFDDLTLAPEEIENILPAALLEQQGFTAADFIHAADIAYQQQAYHTAWYWYHIVNKFDSLKDEAAFRFALLEVVFNHDGISATKYLNALTLSREEIQDMPPVDFFEQQGISAADYLQAADAAFQQRSYRAAWHWYLIADSFEQLIGEPAFRFDLIDLAFNQSSVSGSALKNHVLTLDSKLTIKPTDLFRFESGGPVNTRVLESETASHLVGYFYFNSDPGGVIINVTNSGDYCIHVYALDKPPASTEIELTHNLERVLLMQLPQGDNEMRIFETNLFLEEGFHIIGIRLTNDGKIDGVDRNAHVGIIMLESCSD